MVSASESDIYKLCAELLIGSVEVSRWLSSVCRLATEFAIDNPAASSAAVSTIMPTAILPGVVPKNPKMREMICVEPEKEEWKNRRRSDMPGASVVLASSSQWSWAWAGTDSTRSDESREVRAKLADISSSASTGRSRLVASL